MDIDVTLIAQLSILVALIVALRPLLVGPLLTVLQARHDQMGGAQLEVRQLERLTHADREVYKERMARARHEVHLVRESLRQAGREQAAAKEQAARAQLLQEQKLAQKALLAAEQQASASLAHQTELWAEELATKLLARKIGS